ncbi:MAG: DedA family protein [Candidatus Pacebacteria bacterium]|nr:DedA family protein [Candidatus Paceibacterota bacterium]
MIHFVIHFLNTNILPIVNQIGVWFYIIVAIVALLESTIIIGTFVPGTIILLFFGFTASQDNVSVFWVIVATSIGAVIGDFISYYIGRYGSGFIKSDKGILRISHVNIGKAFFAKHGSVSVLLGRFVSPIRQIIPFIAGAVHMTYRRFLYLNIIGALLWAISYILLGYYFGANWRLIDKVIMRVGVVLTVVIVGAIIYFFNKRREKKLNALGSVDLKIDGIDTDEF